jgi:transcriptional regulator with XRE-family HTH domain
MTKNLEREAARKLRKEQGLTIIEIAKIIGVAKSSVSLWVRDIELTEAQFEVIQQQHYTYGAQHKGSKANIAKHHAIRQQYQEEGRMKARENDPAHILGCMLYWGEGRKSRSELNLANSDPDMLVVFMRFLQQVMGVTLDEISIAIHCYLNNGLSQEEIEQYWLKTLGLSQSHLRKTMVNQPRSSQQKGRKLLYGVCQLRVDGGTRYLQHIYGAIQEYTGIDKPEWLD